MRAFLLVVAAAGLAGGIIAWALLPLVTEPLVPSEFGPVQLELSTTIYSRGQILVGVFLASTTAAALAFGLARGFVPARRRRR